MLVAATGVSGCHREVCAVNESGGRQIGQCSGWRGAGGKCHSKGWVGCQGSSSCVPGSSEAQQQAHRPMMLILLLACVGGWPAQGLKGIQGDLSPLTDSAHGVERGRRKQRVLAPPPLPEPHMVGYWPDADAYHQLAVPRAGLQNPIVWHSAPRVVAYKPVPQEVSPALGKAHHTDWPLSSHLLAGPDTGPLGPHKRQVCPEGAGVVAPHLGTAAAAARLHRRLHPH